MSRREPIDNTPVVTFSNVSKITSSALVLKAISHSGNGRFATISADGDRFHIVFFSEGGETQLQISTQKSNDRGIWDLYVDGVLDSSGYDDYAASAAAVHRSITLRSPLSRGYHLFELRVNGKNASSSAYLIQVFGASIQ